MGISTSNIKEKSVKKPKSATVYNKTVGSASKPVLNSSIPISLAKKAPIGQDRLSLGCSLDKIPKFISRETLFAQDMNGHLSRILENEKEKQIFLQMIQDLFIFNPQINLKQYCSPEFQPFRDASFIQPVTPLKMDQLDGLRICALDGGLGWRKFLGIQLTLVKTAVVTYEFHGKNRPKILYYPDTHNDARYMFYTDYDLIDENYGSILAGYRRSIAELRLLLEYLESTPLKPHIIILDGSLTIPPFPFHIPAEHEVHSFYPICVQYYRYLYDFCERYHIQLVGSVKDTKSTTLRDLINRAFPTYLNLYDSLKPFYALQYRQIFKRFTDTELLFKIMPPQSRTVIFQPYGLAEFHPNSNDNRINPGSSASQLPNVTQEIFASYIQYSAYDIPLRLEFWSPAVDTEILPRLNRIAAILYPLTAINTQCTLPLPQIEAHLRAHLPEEEMDFISGQLERLFKTKNLINWTYPPASPVLVQKSPYPQPELDLQIKSFYSTFMTKRHDRLPFGK